MSMGSDQKVYVYIYVELKLESKLSFLFHAKTGNGITLQSDEAVRPMGSIALLALCPGVLGVLERLGE